jgi:hypothetical protein
MWKIYGNTCKQGKITPKAKKAVAEVMIIRPHVSDSCVSGYTILVATKTPNPIRQ